MTKKFIDIHDLLTVFRARSKTTETEGKLRIDAMHIMKMPIWTRMGDYA